MRHEDIRIYMDNIMGATRKTFKSMLASSIYCCVIGARLAAPYYEDCDLRDESKIVASLFIDQRHLIFIS
mgnify:FL=1